MTQPTTTASSGSSLEEIRSTVEDLIRSIADPELAEGILFPHGINKINVTVKLGEAEVRVEVEGPDHGHDHDHGDWMEEDGLFEEDDEE